MQGQLARTLGFVAALAAPSIAAAPQAIGEWTAMELAKLTGGGVSTLDYFGKSVAICGDRILAGASGDDLVNGSLLDEGSAYVFERDQGGPGAWGEVLLLHSSDAGTGDLFGSTVAISGTTTVAGAFSDDNGGGLDAGAAYVNELVLSGVNYCTAGVSASGCQAVLSAAGASARTAARPTPGTTGRASSASCPPSSGPACSGAPEPPAPATAPSRRT